MKKLLLGLVVLSTISCGPGGTATTRPTSREVRGQAPMMFQGQTISRVVVVNAQTNQIVAQTTVNASGMFVLPNVPTGATYRLQAIYGRQSVPITYTTSRNGIPNQRVNTFSIGVQRNGVVGPLAGPVDFGAMQSEGSTGSIEPPASNAPDLQEDWDEDGMPDGLDPDWDGDNIPNAMDTDEKNDGMPDSVQYGDTDGDGLTNEADPDIDGDGMLNALDPDNDNDGILDTMDTTPTGVMGTPDDCDGDGLLDSEDETPCGQDLPIEPTDGGVPNDEGPPADGGTPEDAGPPADV